MDKRTKLVLGAGLAVVCCLVAIGVWRDLKAADWAAWVQAVGSIAAIVGAIWIAGRDGRRAREAAEDYALRKRALAIALVRDLGEHCELQLQSFEGRFVDDVADVPVMKLSLDEARMPLQVAPLWELTDVALVQEIASLRYKASMTSHQLEVEPKLAVHAFYRLRDGCRAFLMKVESKDL